MRLIVLFILGFGTCTLGGIVPRPKAGAEYEDAFMEPLDILQKYGYPAENHTVQTEDGYLLTLHRIPNGRLCSADKNKGPVLVQHGLLSSSVDWFITGTEKGLPYILADNCYDVWLGNSRGNTYSKAHAYLDVKSDEYWNFSWHELGKYDTPAAIDYILETTGRKDLFYIGHSQGTTQYFVFSSLHPEYTEKVKAGFMLAPSVFFGHCPDELLHLISKFQGALGWVADNIGINEFLPHSDLISKVGGELCSEKHPNLEEMCKNIYFILDGFDSEMLNETLIPILLGHVPAGAATKQFLHYAQSINTGKFRQYDYGEAKNNLTYGQPEPPEYDLSNVKIPTYLHYSKNDDMVAIEDVEILAEILGDTVKEKILIPWDKFSHLDFIIATEAPTLVYDKILELMNSY